MSFVDLGIRPQPELYNGGLPERHPLRDRLGELTIVYDNEPPIGRLKRHPGTLIWLEHSWAKRTKRHHTMTEMMMGGYGVHPIMNDRDAPWIMAVVQDEEIGTQWTFVSVSDEMTNFGACWPAIFYRRPTEVRPQSDGRLLHIDRVELTATVQLFWPQKEQVCKATPTLES